VNFIQGYIATTLASVNEAGDDARTKQQQQYKMICHKMKMIVILAMVAAAQRMM